MATITYKGRCVICNKIIYGEEVCPECNGDTVDTYQHDGSIIHAKEPGIPAPVPGFYSRRM